MTPQRNPPTTIGELVEKRSATKGRLGVPTTDYSWEHLAPDRKREVLGMIRSASNKKRGKRIGIILCLLLVLAVLAIAYVVMTR